MPPCSRTISLETDLFRSEAGFNISPATDRRLGFSILAPRVSAWWWAQPGVPAWAKKHLFVRGEVGFLHLITVGVPGSVGYGSSGGGRNQATFLAEAGVLF